VSLRERKKAETRQRIQQHAMRLFLEQGYDATTVEQIAAAVGVSHMTFFRHFPAKEDVVATDDYDPLMAELIRARPAGEHPVERVRATVLGGLAAVYDRDRDTILARTQLIQSTPALRARIVDNRRASEAVFAAGLGDPDDFATRVLAAACVGALVTAVTEWAEHPERAELPELVDRAFTALREQLA
jgi:AcrR family transcriptional regulator